MARAMLSLALLAAALGLLACEQSGYRPAFAVFRFTDANGQPIQLVGSAPLNAHEPGVVLARNRTSLPDGRQVVQELVAVDPLELPATEYTVGRTSAGLVTVTGGSLDGYVVTPPKLAKAR